MKLTDNLSKDDKKIIHSIFWRSFGSFAGRAGGQIRQQAPGFIWTIKPALDMYYKDDKEGHRDALMRHTTFYNITQYVGTFVMGLVAAMEKEYSKNKNFDPNAIVAIKTSLMGPLSGIGDSIFWGVLRIVSAGIGISLSANGSILGPIVFLLVFNIPATIARYYASIMGFTLGADFIEKIHESGAMNLLTKAASILGLLMVGAMTASIVKFNSIMEFAVENGDPVKLQTYLDQIFKGIIPLSVTLLCFYALKKNINVNLIMFGVMFLAILLALVGIV